MNRAQLGVTPGLNANQPGQPAQQSLSSLIFFIILLTLINSGPGQSTDQTGGLEAYVPTRAKLDRRINELDNYRAYATGNASTNYTVPGPTPQTLLSTLLPPLSSIPPSHPHPLYPRNITGFIRHASSHAFNLSDPLSNRTSSPFLRTRLFDRLPAGWDSSPLFNARPVVHLPPVAANDTVPEAGPRNRTERRAAGDDASGDLWRDEQASSAMRNDFAWLPPSMTGGSVSEGPKEGGALDVAMTLREGWWGKENNRAGDGWALGGPEQKQREWGAVRGSVDYTSAWSGQTVSYNVQGAHHFDTGKLYLLASANSSIIDLRLLPSFFPPFSSAWNVTSGFVIRALEERVQVLQEEFDSGYPPSDDEMVGAPTTCPLQIVLQLAPLPHHITPADVLAAESELFFPTGLSVKTWDVRLEQASWWSWECGVAGVLEGGHGLRSSSFWRMSNDYSFLSLLAAFTTVGLLVGQMERSRTPSQLSKVALGTIVMQVILDGWLLVAHLMVGIVIDNHSSLSLIAPGFVSGIGFLMFGPRFCMAISRTQEPEAARRAAAPTPPAAPPAPAAAPAALPLPTTTTSDPSPQIMPGALPPSPAPAPRVPTLVVSGPDGTATALPGTQPRVVVRPPLPPNMFLENQGSGPQPIINVLALLLVLGFLLLQTNLLPTVFPFVIFTFYLFWLPQIIRNAQRGTHRAFSWWYILGTTAARIWPLGYFWGGWGGANGGENVLFLERSTWLQAVMISLAVQLAVLALQDVYSPTFFLPARFAPPPAYDYHPALPRADDVESKGKGGWGEMGDCSICMEPIVPSEAEAAGAVGGGGAAAGGRKSWAVAPCQHAFHTACLEPWLAIRSVCPHCRRPLPPL